MGSVGSGQSYTSFLQEDYGISYGHNADSPQAKFMVNNTNLDEWEQGLNPDERNSIERFTGSNFRQVNDALYNVPFNDMEYDLQQRILNISNAINKFDLRKGIEVTRESSASIFGGNDTPEGIKNFLKATNGVLQINGFMSTAVSDKGAGYDDDIISVHYRIPPSIGAGAYVDRISSNAGENEFLLNRNGVYRYNPNSIRVINGKIHINAEWIGQATEQVLKKKKK